MASATTSENMLCYSATSILHAGVYPSADGLEVSSPYTLQEWCGPRFGCSTCCALHIAELACILQLCNHTEMLTVLYRFDSFYEYTREEPTMLEGICREGELLFVPRGQRVLPGNSCLIMTGVMRRLLGTDRSHTLVALAVPQGGGTSPSISR